MPRDLHPSDGARYLLERLALIDDGAAARYRAAIYTPDAEFAASAVLGEDGNAALEPTGAPPALHARLATLAKLVARDAARLRRDGLPGWPQRILRWRR